MAGNNKLPKDKVPVKIDRFIRMEANSATRQEKLLELFGIDLETADPKKIHSCDQTMCRWRKHPLYDAIWKDEVRRQDYGDYSEARKALRRSMRQDDKWLVMQAAVNVLNSTNKKIFGSDENNVTVHIEGMPDIGSPDDNDG